MMQTQENEKARWDATKELLQDYRVVFGSHWSFNFRNDPKRLPFVLSRYKFAAKMGSKNRRILELGCSDGIGTTVLAEGALGYTGVDLDQPAIEAAKKNFPTERFSFLYDDFMGRKYGEFETVVSLDVIEHILPEYIDQYYETILSNLSKNGLCIIGTPNITSAPYASKASQIGHVNLYSQERLIKELQRYFHQVLPFGMNDETLHTGYAPMCHYLMCVACHRKEKL